MSIGGVPFTERSGGPVQHILKPNHSLRLRSFGPRARGFSRHAKAESRQKNGLSSYLGVGIGNSSIQIARTSQLNLSSML
jgi:hypothetical protein